MSFNALVNSVLSSTLNDLAYIRRMSRTLLGLLHCGHDGFVDNHFSMQLNL